MAQPVFPTLSRQPSANDDYVHEPSTDPTNRTPLADGAYLVQAKSTYVPDFWSFVMHGMTAADRATLLSFWSGDANYGAVPIKFTDPDDGQDYFVHFAGRPRCKRPGNSTGTYTIAIKFIEAVGTYT